MQSEKSTHQKDNAPDKNFIRVALVTTAGSYPEIGYDTIPVHQKIDVFIKKAVSELHILSTDGWVAKVGTKKISVDETYLQNGLTGDVAIDFGPEAGGGGNE